MLDSSNMTEEKAPQADQNSQSIDIKDEPGNTTVHSQESSGAKNYIRILSYSDKWDWLLNGVGALAAIASGASLAL